MRALRTKANVVPPDSDYPFGRIKDDDGSKNGTPVNESVCGDSFQFFEKLMLDAQLAMNGLPENVYSGFQLNQALGILFKMFAVNIGLGGKDVGDGYNGGTINIPSGHDLQTLPSQNLAPFNKFNGNRYFGGFFSVSSGATNVPIAGQAGTLIDIYGNAGEELQIFFTDDQKAYFNIKTSGSWLGWIQFAGAISWIDVSSFGTNWANSSSESKCQYRKDFTGRVWVKGTLSCSSVPSTGAVMFTLPAGFRPPAYSSGIYVASPQLFTGSNVSIVKVDSAGEVIILFPGTEVTSGTIVQLGEFSFSIDGTVTP